MIKIYLLIIFIINFISGCTPIDYTRPVSKPPVYERSATREEGLQQEQRQLQQDQQQHPKVITTAALDRAPSVSMKKKSVPASRQAVLDLLAQSKSAIEEQNYANAENLLKRALRIEPGNAWLWHNMAVVKFYQEDYQQAIQQALKSNNLEKDNHQLRTNNAKIIKQSYIELGEPEKVQHF
ncbi:MAG: tetratricopeptide repeat protein [Gammaproteobacteria bacterium]|nr:tetratricopeptide repeat protein [Gammaproteobacteria bacterium]